MKPYVAGWSGKYLIEAGKLRKFKYHKISMHLEIINQFKGQVI